MDDFFRPAQAKRLAYLTRDSTPVTFIHMVNYSSEALGAIFSALSDPTRRAIVDRLAQGSATVTEVAQPFPMSLPAISKHLRILEHAGLIVRQKEGRIHHLRLTAAPMGEVAAWLDRYRRHWEAQFDALDGYLTSQANEEKRLDGNLDDRPNA